jgi:pullulanase/glycogen debranching enzyme
MSSRGEKPNGRRAKKDQPKKSQPKISQHKKGETKARPRAGAREVTSQAERATAILPGSPFPLGATPREGGTNFAVASGTADGIVLCLFDGSGAETKIPLPELDAGVWYGFVPGVGPGQAYGYRATGPYDTARGARCLPAKL